MRINHKILSIPPYISTSWKNIASLHIDNQETALVLIITLLNGTSIQVPNLEAPIIEAIFGAHAKFMEQEQNTPSQKPPSSPKLPLEALSSGATSPQVFGFNVPMKENIPIFDNMSSMLQHNAEQAESDELPSEILSKIANIAKNLGIEDLASLPKPEPHCNCPHCQIARAMHNGVSGIEEVTAATPVLEEVVSDADLKFRTWDIAQTGDKLFIVTNPLDDKEHYSVFLGEPIGCTCGDKHCEHIRAVLSS